MSRQVQTTKQKSAEVEAEVEEVPTEVNDQSEQVLEDAVCCLADIEEVLKDCEPKLPTDEEILEKGHPNWSSRDYDIDYSLGGEEYDKAYDEAYARYDADEKAFHEAYERVNGVAYEHSGCGCSQ